MVVLGISIGTRSTGVAVLSKEGLVEARTLSFKKSWSEQKAEHIVFKYKRYVLMHSVTVASIKLPPKTHRTSAILSILKKLVGMLEYHGCMVEYKTNKEVKQAIPRIRNATDLMAYTATRYPELLPNIERELVNRNKYHYRMFEAVLVAHLSKEQYRDTINDFP